MQAADVVGCTSGPSGPSRARLCFQLLYMSMNRMRVTLPCVSLVPTAHGRLISNGDGQSNHPRHDATGYMCESREGFQELTA